MNTQVCIGWERTEGEVREVKIDLQRFANPNNLICRFKGNEIHTSLVSFKSTIRTIPKY
jgi:hypothetical protein